MFLANEQNSCKKYFFICMNKIFQTNQLKNACKLSNELKEQIAYLIISKNTRINLKLLLFLIPMKNLFNEFQKLKGMKN